MDGIAILGKGSNFNFAAKFSLTTKDDHPDPPTTLVVKAENERSAVINPEDPSNAKPASTSIVNSELT